MSDESKCDILVAALRKVANEAGRFCGERFTSVAEEENDLPCIENGDSLHAAVVALESHLEGKLPPIPWGFWNRLLLLSRLQIQTDLERIQGFEAAAKLAEWCDTEANRISGVKPLHVVPNANDKRDKFIYQSRLSGESLKAILAGVKKHSEWEQLQAESSVAKALKRYCKRQCLSVPKTSH
jgi:hypothetical protein